MIRILDMLSSRVAQVLKSDWLTNETSFRKMGQSHCVKRRSVLRRISQFGSRCNEMFDLKYLNRPFCCSKKES